MKVGDRARALVRAGARPDLFADRARDHITGTLTAMRSASPAVILFCVSFAILTASAASSLFTYIICMDPAATRLRRVATEAGIDIDKMPVDDLVARLQTNLATARIIEQIKTYHAPLPGLAWTAKSPGSQPVAAQSIDDAIRDFARFLITVPEQQRGQALSELRAVASWNDDARDLVAALRDVSRTDLDEITLDVKWLSSLAPSARSRLTTTFAYLPADPEHLWLMGQVAVLSNEDAELLYRGFFVSPQTRTAARRALSAIAAKDRSFLQFLNTTPIPR